MWGVVVLSLYWVVFGFYLDLAEENISPSMTFFMAAQGHHR